MLGPLAEGANVVIPYADTDPALLDRPLGRGHALVLTTPVSDAASQRDPWNMLPTGDEPWPFVMLSNEMLHYLTGSSKLNYLAGDTALVRMPADQHHTIFSLLPPVGDPIRQAVNERDNAITVTGTDEIGHYRLSAGGAEQGTHLGFSVNLPADVSQLDRIGADELKAVFGDVPYRVARDRADIVRDVNFGRVGRELYPPLIVILIAVMALEQLLANRFYRPGDRRTASAAAQFARERDDTRRTTADSGPTGSTQPTPPPLPTAAAEPPPETAVLP